MAKTINEAWVKLYDDKRYKDRRLTIKYPKTHSSLKKVKSDEGKRGFNDKTSSVKWDIPLGWQAVLFDDEGFKDSRYELTGVGKVKQISDVGSFNDKASSLRWERNTDATPITRIEDAWIELYDDKGFKDRRVIINYPTKYKHLRNVRSEDGKKGFNDKTSSVRWQIPFGWMLVLYDDRDWKDNAFDLIGTGNVEEIPDLGTFSDKTSSVRWERRP